MVSNFVVISIEGKEKGYAQKKEANEQAKIKHIREHKKEEEPQEKVEESKQEETQEAEGE